MSPEQNKALVLKFYEVFDQQDIELGRELMAPDIISRGLDIEPLIGIDAVIQYGMKMFSAFPDGQHHLDEVIAEGEKVVTRGSYCGTHQGDFMGIPPTGKQVRFSVFHVDRVIGGQIVEHWGQGNALDLMQQLGIVFLPGPKLIPYLMKGFVYKLFSRPTQPKL